MDRSTVRHLAIVAVFAAGGCNGFKMAGSTYAGGAGRGGNGGAAGTGGTGGMGGMGGTGGAAGTTGRGGTGPLIIIDAGDGDRPTVNCGGKSKTGMKVAPDILILLDRSGSMNDCLMPDAGMNMNCGANSKWAKLIPAITQVVGETDTEVNWGLKFFPDNSASTCSVTSTAAVDVAPGNGAAITTAIMAATQTNGGVVGYNGTPTRAAETGAATYLGTLTDSSPKFILLATDGLPTCPASGAGGMMGAMGDDSASAPPAVAAANTAGFKTFVVGISTTGPADTTLSNMANAGGLARTGTPSYYPVASSDELAAAIRTLIGVAATCTFQIGPAPTDDGSTSLDKIDVFGDGKPIMRDTTHTDGYDYTDATKMQIQVYGSRCADIMSGAIVEVSVTFACIPL